MQYDKYEFNIFNEYDQKVIYRDYNKESQVISLLNSLGFDHVNGKFYLTFGDNYNLISLKIKFMIFKT